MKVLTDLIGLSGLVVMVLSFQQKKAKGVLLLQLISTALFATHFGLKGAYTVLLLMS